MPTNHTHTTNAERRRRSAYALGLADAIGEAMRDDAEHAAIVAVPGHGTDTSPWLLTHRPGGEPVSGWQLSRRARGAWADVLAFGGSLDAAAAFMASYDDQHPPVAEPLPLWPVADRLAIAA